MIMEPPLNELETPSHLTQSCDAIFEFFLFVAMYSLSLYWFCFTLSWYSQFHLASLFLYLLYGFVSIYDHFTLLLCKIQNVSVRNASCECWIAINKHLLSLQIEPLLSRCSHELRSTVCVIVILLFVEVLTVGMKLFRKINPTTDGAFLFMMLCLLVGMKIATV